MDRKSRLKKHVPGKLSIPKCMKYLYTIKLYICDYDIFKLMVRLEKLNLNAIILVTKEAHVGAAAEDFEEAEAEEALIEGVVEVEEEEDAEAVNVVVVVVDSVVEVVPVIIAIKRAILQENALKETAVNKDK